MKRLRSLRLSACVVAAVCGAAATLAQPPKGPDLKAPGREIRRVANEGVGLANPFWQHVMGCKPMLPCTHMVPEHPEGDPVMAPCTHMKKLHPEGDKIKFRAKNPVTGKEEGPELEKVVPCVHLVPEHPEGHPTGAKVPCVHLKPQHPEGHEGPMGPCPHPVALVSSDEALGLAFYTGNADVQQAAREGARKLKDLGVAPSGAAGALGRSLVNGGLQEVVRGRLAGNPRSLAVFAHPPVNGDPTDNKDPMWSHYNPALHYVQITRDDRASVSAEEKRKDIRETMFHELGHAICGHKCVVPMTKGKPHSLDKETDPGQAVSEGWACFVAMVLSNPRDAASAMYAGIDLETVTDTRIPLSAKAEARVAAMLWDLYDTRNEPGDDVAMNFSELYKVFSPTMQTVLNGPAIPDMNDYLERLANNNPNQRAKIMAIRDLNLRAPGPTRSRPGRP